MKISIKLKWREAFAMTDVFERSLAFNEPCGTRADAITNMLLIKLYQKIKMKSLFIEKPFKVSFDEETALAFCEFFENNEVKMSVFETALMQRIMMQLDQKVARLYTFHSFI